MVFLRIPVTKHSQQRPIDYFDTKIQCKRANSPWNHSELCHPEQPPADAGIFPKALFNSTEYPRLNVYHFECMR